MDDLLIVELDEPVVEYEVMDEDQPGPSHVEPGPSHAVPGDRMDQSREFKWSVQESKLLIELYGKYSKKIGTLQVKNTKMLWVKLAEELGKLSITVTPNNCMNRWRVLERNYKKFVDNQTKTGRGRKFFEYEADMEAIFEKKKNINPELILDTQTRDEIREEAGGGEVQLVEPADIRTTSSPAKRSKAEVLKRKTSTLEKMRVDRKAYYDARLAIESKKLELLAERNSLIRERNELIRNGHNSIG